MNIFNKWVTVSKVTAKEKLRYYNSVIDRNKKRISNVVPKLKTAKLKFKEFRTLGYERDVNYYTRQLQKWRKENRKFNKLKKELIEK